MIDSRGRRGAMTFGRLLRPMLILAATLLVAGFSLVGTAAPASAHNVLRSTSPADKATVDRTPAQVVLTFDEPAIAMGTQFVVTGPNGPVQIGPPRLVDNTVSQELSPGSPAGAYTVAWRVTSADGHPITGEFGFTSSAAGTGTPSPSASASAGLPTDAPAPISKQAGPPGFVWVGVLVVIGAVGFLIWRAVRRRTGRQPQD